ncbi:MAG: Gfo/Idh/MocA family oxidoreductase [Candidatus Omnitrophica bacterium]|nr:Gfo/Idh/MocA family oxidoreductase [Candidatus Omnitrophota bacterium]
MGTTAKLKLAIIGCGNWGSNLLRNLVALENAQLKWACDANALKLADVRKKYPKVQCTSVFTDILEDPEVHGVVIATPPISHAAVAKQVLRAGKHVFVEKPIALSVDDARQVAALAEKQGLILMVGHLLRYHPGILKLKEIIDSGELGEIFYVYSQRLNLGTIRRFENALWNLGCHDLSIINYLLGELPARVAAMGKSFAQVDVEDTVFVYLDYDNKKMGHIHLSWLDPHKVRKMTVVGSKKMAVFDDMEPQNKITIYDKGFVVPEEDSLDVPIEVRQGKSYYPVIHHQEPLHLELQHFAECIRKGKQPRTDGWEGLQVVDILVAAQKSLENHGRLESPSYSKANKQSQSPKVRKKKDVSPFSAGSPCKVPEGT